MASTVLGRQLFRGSLPYTGPPFNPSWGPIGSGRPSSYLFGTPAGAAAFNRLKAELKRLQKPKVSKLAQCFPTETPILDATNRDDPAIPVDDQGISYDTELWLFHMYTALDSARLLAATRRKVTSDLRALLATLSREQGMVACTVMRNYLMDSETIAAKVVRWEMDMMLQEDDDEISRLPSFFPAERALSDSVEAAERALSDSDEGNDEQNTTTDEHQAMDCKAILWQMDMMDMMDDDGIDSVTKFRRFANALCGRDDGTAEQDTATDESEVEEEE